MLARFATPWLPWERVRNRGAECRNAPARRERSRSPFRRHRHAGNLYLERAQARARAKVRGFPIVAAKRYVGGVAKAMDDAAEFLAGWIENIEAAGAAAKNVPGRIDLHVECTPKVRHGK